MMKNESGFDDRTIIQSSDELGRPNVPKIQFPYLVVVDGPRIGRKFSLKGDSVIIGRGLSADIQLEDASVSRQHVKFTKDGDSWCVEDLGSKNLTMVNGKGIKEKVVLGHKDLIKVGIYLFKLILKEVTQVEEMDVPPGMDIGERTIMAEMPEASPDTPTSTESLKPSQEEGLDEKETSPEIPIPVEPKFSIKNYMRYFIIAAIVIIGAVGFYFGWTHFLSSKPDVEVVNPNENKDPIAIPMIKEVNPNETQPEFTPPIQSPQDTGSTPPTETPPQDLQAGSGVPVKPQPPNDLQQPPSTQPEAPPSQQATTPPVSQPALNARPVFLDFVSSPLAAKVTFLGKEIGTTPIRVNLELEEGKDYAVEGSFDMPDLGEKYQLVSKFILEAGKQVIPIFLKAPIGMLKIENIPRDATLYLKGRFEHQKHAEKAAKLENIALQKPIYLPYGAYDLELRRSRKLSENSPTVVESIIFTRKFTLAQESPSFTIDVNDDSIKKFPTAIRTDPADASVYMDGTLAGKTPFIGEFGLGRHKLVLKKDGYFDYSEDLDVDVNTPFELDVKLQTSIAGAHLNNARSAYRRGVYQTAVDELAEALASSPTESEVATANLYLGKSYIKLGNFERAIGYFNTLLNTDQRYPAMLGLVESYYELKDRNKALPLLVEVLLKVKDMDLKKEANALFQKISPLHSILYVYSEPSGARVFVNDKNVGQVTPMILYELALGNYKLRIEKDGYETTNLNMNLAVSEFNPVVVTLRPVKGE